MTAVGFPPVTLLVNSSDGFDDCWPVYFSLLKEHWPIFDYPILLNTETSSYASPIVDLKCSKVALGESERLSWSECLIRAIDQIGTPLLLYMQEDYFIDTPVRHEVVSDAVQVMLANPDIGHIGLTKHGSHPPFSRSRHSGFGVIGQNARYRISTQAGLWRPEVLKSYLDKRENGWMFEIFGTRRAHRRNDLFLTADFAPENGGPAIDYVHTGIIKGRWHEAMPSLFARHNLKMDFSKRGFYRAPSFGFGKVNVLKKLMQNPAYAMRQIFLAR